MFYNLLMYKFNEAKIFSDTSLMGLMCNLALAKNELTPWLQKIADQYKKQLVELDNSPYVKPENSNLYYIQKEQRNLNNLFLGNCYYGLKKADLDFLREHTLQEVLPRWLENVTLDDWNQYIYYFYREKDEQTSCPTTAWWLMAEQDPLFIQKIFLYPKVGNSLKNCQCLDILWEDFLRDENLVDLLIKNEIWPEFFYDQFLNPCVKTPAIFQKIIDYLPLHPKMEPEIWRNAKYVVSSLYYAIAKDGSFEQWQKLFNKCGIDFEIVKLLLEEAWKGKDNKIGSQIDKFDPENSSITNIFNVTRTSTSIDKINLELMDFHDRDSQCLNSLLKFFEKYFPLLDKPQIDEWMGKILFTYSGDFRKNLLGTLFSQGHNLLASHFLTKVQSFKNYYSDEGKESNNLILSWVVETHFKKIFESVENKEQYNILIGLFQFAYHTPYNNSPQKSKNNLKSEEILNISKQLFKQSFLYNYIPFDEFQKDTSMKELVPDKYRSILQLHEIKKDAKQKHTKKIVLL